MTAAFTHDGLAVSVAAPDDDLTWLRECLEPAFAVVPAGPDDVRISFEQAGGAYVDGSHTHDRTLFVLDSGPLSLPSSQIADGTRVHDAAKQLTIDVTDGGRRTGIRYHGNRLGARVRLLRVVREYAHNHSLSSGGVMLHAAAVTFDGAAIAIAGPKGVGKTTLSLRMLGVPGVEYLSNDRVLVRFDQPPRALAIPTVIALRIGTRMLLDDLASRLQHCGDFREHAEERRVRGSRPPIIAGDVWRISPQQLCTALDCRLHAAAPLAAVVFPTGDRPASARIHRLQETEATAALQEALLCRGSGQYTSALFVESPTAQPGEDDIRASCRWLAQSVPCFSLGLPDDSTIDDLSRVLARLVASGDRG